MSNHTEYDSNESAYAEEVATGVFLKLKPNSETRLRVVSLPIKYDKPVEFDGKKDIRTQWAWLVIAKELGTDGKPKREMKILDAGSPIYAQFRNLALSEDWGDIRQYDVKIKRDGEGKQTKYFVTPVPKTPLSESEQQLVSECEIDLKAIVLKEGTDGNQSNPPSGYDPFAEE